MSTLIIYYTKETEIIGLKKGSFIKPKKGSLDNLNYGSLNKYEKKS
jgi:hypothetical protein